ncbi:MAG: phosphatidate cytidylyltransferase [Anaerolineales bacterium]
MNARILTALAGVPLVVICLVVSVWTTLALAGLVISLAAFELLRMMQSATPYRLAALIAIIWVCLTLPFLLPDPALVLVWLVAGFAALINHQMNGLPRWWASSAGYLGLLAMPIMALRLMPDFMTWLTILFVGTWLTDTMALFGGRYFGRRQLSPISPRKTWEGTIIGIIFGGLGIFLSGWLTEALTSTPLVVILASILLPPLAVLGDLFESAIKRHYNHKDSGRLLPGHGGLLDRVDSLLFTIPALWLLVLLF